MKVHFPVAFACFSDDEVETEFCRAPLARNLMFFQGCQNDFKNYEKSSMFKYLLLLSYSLLISACGGGAGGAPGAPVIVPVVPVIPVVTYPLSEMRILVMGQSISSNCNEHVYPAVNNVFQVAKDGSIKVALDPFEWADCNKGSMWMPLGKKIIEAGIARKVIFMPIGVAASKVGDWQAGGSVFGKLNSAIALIQAQGINFDFVFWHPHGAFIAIRPLKWVKCNLYRTVFSHLKYIFTAG